MPAVSLTPRHDAIVTMRVIGAAALTGLPEGVGLRVARHSSVPGPLRDTRARRDMGRNDGLERVRPEAQ